MSESTLQVPVAFSFDPEAAVAHLRSSDRALGRLIESVGPFRMRLNPTPSIFTALSEAIVYQQLTGKAAATIYGRLCASFPRSQTGPTAKQLLGRSVDQLRAVGLSGSKIRALQDLAEKVLTKKIPDLKTASEMDDAALIEALTSVRGVGPWTVHMFLMFRLGRPDVLPADDYGIRKGFALTFKKRNLPARTDIHRRGAKWAPYRTVASWYLWRAVDLHRTQSSPGA